MILPAPVNFPQRCFQPLEWLHRRDGGLIDRLPMLHNLKPTTWQYTWNMWPRRLGPLWCRHSG